MFFVIFMVQYNLTAQNQQVQVGDVYTIEAPSEKEYRYIYFPKRNFIIKQGGTADMDLVRNLKVIVTSVEYREGDITLVTLKRKDGGRFFRGLFTVKAYLDGALDAGELSST